MQLRDAGRLRLDDPVSERLPWFSLSGEPWSQYVEQHIFQPLGMTASRGLDVGAEAPAGNLASNVEGMAKFVSLQFRDGPVGVHAPQPRRRESRGAARFAN